MNIYFSLYLALWISACIIVVIVCLKDKDSYAFSRSDYWQFLFKRWKVVTFIVAATGMTVVAPYTDDYTWDYYDGFFMSVLAFLTAPWAVGAIYKIIRKELPLKQIYVAFCIWMFSASWSYDLYLVFRDGYYPDTWLVNIPASSVLYLSAGLYWNLDWKKDKGTILSFREDDWPSPSPHTVFPKIFWFTLPFMIVITIIILAFVYIYLNT